jgi:prepilin-type N-terminal cleavage/methylation domain-containing protein
VSSRPGRAAEPGDPRVRTLVAARSSRRSGEPMGMAGDESSSGALASAPRDPAAEARAWTGASGGGADEMSRVGSTFEAGRRASGDGGFTLIESLTASVILLVVSVGVITTLITTAGWYAKARLRTEAYSVANQVMSTILSRNYSEMKLDGGESYPTGIPSSMSWPRSGDARFTVATSMETTTDGETGLEMKRIEVSAIPVAQSLDPTVTVVRFASGWQKTDSATQKFAVTVKVQITPYQPTDEPLGAGAVVWLIAGDSRTFDVQANKVTPAYSVATDSSGVATFHNVIEGQYYLTVDPRSGPGIFPVYFPQRISPTHGGSANSPIMPVNTYSIVVTKNANGDSKGAVLRVGAYETEGWTVVDGKPQPPEVPYKVVEGLVVYASPVLNTNSDAAGLYGLGSEPLYPDEGALPVYSAVVDNGYGVASIPIPWTIDPIAGQYWKVWCTTKDANGHVIVHRLTTTASGGWDQRRDRPEGAYNAVSADYGSILQFPRLGSGAIPVNNPAPSDIP